MVKYLVVSIGLFLIGVLGIFMTRKNIILILMSVELMLLAVNINFVVFSVYLNDMIGQLCSLYVLTVAASESAIGLAILVIYYRAHGVILTSYIKDLKG